GPPHRARSSGPGRRRQATGMLASASSQGISITGNGANARALHWASTGEGDRGGPYVGVVAGVAGGEGGRPAGAARSGGVCVWGGRRGGWRQRGGGGGGGGARGSGRAAAPPGSAARRW